VSYHHDAAKLTLSLAWLLDNKAGCNVAKEDRLNAFDDHYTAAQELDGDICRDVYLGTHKRVV
jgi:hypothetical protein